MTDPIWIKQFDRIMSEDAMELAHRRDYAEKERMGDLRRALTTFVMDPPSRLPRGTAARIDDVISDLKRAEDAVTAAWN